MSHSGDVFQFFFNLNVFSVSCMWPADEKGHSSTFRQVIVIHFVLASYSKELENKEMKVLKDNDNAARIVLLAVPNIHIFKH